MKSQHDNYAPHRCDFCEGTVEPIVAQSEPLRIGDQLVLLDGVTIGRCNRCGHRYFPSKVVKLAEEIAAHPDRAARVVTVPVAAS